MGQTLFGVGFDYHIIKTQELAENAELYNHELSRRVIDCAIDAHRSIGLGLLESAQM